MSGKGMGEEHPISNKECPMSKGVGGLRHRGLVEGGLEEGGGVGGVVGEEAVLEDVGEDGLDMVGEDGFLAVEDGVGLCRSLQGEAGPDGDRVVAAGEGADGLAEDYV